MKTMIRNIVLLVGFVSLVGTASAQKFAHVSTDSLVQEMALKDSINIKYAAKQKNYDNDYQKMVLEAQKMNDDLERTKKDPTASPAIIGLKQRNLDNFVNTMDQYANDASQELQAYQMELMEPIYAKVREAIEAIAKEKNYTYVIDNQALLVSPPSDDITSLVRKKLGL